MPNTSQSALNIEFTDEQDRTDTSPKYWWLRKSAWYERIWLSVGAIIGLALAIYMPARWLTFPDELKDGTHLFGHVMTFATTLFGAACATIGTMAVKRTFSTRGLLVTHLEGIIVSIAIVAITGAGMMAVRGQINEDPHASTADLRVAAETIRAVHGSALANAAKTLAYLNSFS